jgi:hypothetical protein
MERVPYPNDRDPKTAQANARAAVAFWGGAAIDIFSGVTLTDGLIVNAEPLIYAGEGGLVVGSGMVISALVRWVRDARKHEDVT